MDPLPSPLRIERIVQEGERTLQMETKDMAAVSAQDNQEEEKPIDLEATRKILESLPAKSRRYLIPTLQKVQAVYRYLPDKAVQLIINALGVSRAEIYGVVSFYPQLRITEPGKYIIKLCYGTACFVKGATVIADKIHNEYHILPGQTDKGKLFTLQTASCLGNCGAAPMAIIDEDTHGTIDPEKTSEILRYYKNKKDAEETAEVTAE